jgi:hypothetical protein
LEHQPAGTIREFDKDRSKDAHYVFRIKEEGKLGTMVLDGQQRLQSLYLSLCGSLDGRHLYFDVLSGVAPQDTSEAKYQFEFMTVQQAEERNRQQQEKRHWVRFGEIHECPDIPNRRQLVRTYTAQSGVDADSVEADRLAENVEFAYSKLKAEEILSHYTIDPNYGTDGTPTSIDEILEIFVRINSGGQVLSKSDLMFSLMQLHWEGAAKNIDELLDELGDIGGGFLDFDKDFVLRWLLGPVITEAGFASGLAVGERVTAAHRSTFWRILLWPLAGCAIGAGAVYPFGPMLIVFGMFAVGTVSVIAREAVLHVAEVRERASGKSEGKGR